MARRLKRVGSLRDPKKQFEESQDILNMFAGLKPDKLLPDTSRDPIPENVTEQGDAMMTAGIPESFYDSPDDLAEFIGNDVSQAEFTARVGMAAEAVRSVDPNLKVQLQEMYGVGVENDGELIAYYLDPERATTVIEQRLQLEAAGLSAASLGTLGTGLTAPTAERLADMAVQTREITQRFAGQRAVTQRLVGEESAMTADEFAAASFGLDSEATSDLARLRRQREQRGRRQTGAAMTQTGVTGLGTAR
jgi:hypothetical protein